MMTLTSSVIEPQPSISIPMVQRIETKEALKRKRAKRDDKQTLSLKQTNFSFDVKKDNESHERVHPNASIRQSFIKFIKHRRNTVKTQ
jgi:hypothetical protein